MIRLKSWSFRNEKKVIVVAHLNKFTRGQIGGVQGSSKIVNFSDVNIELVVNYDAKTKTFSETGEQIGEQLIEKASCIEFREDKDLKKSPKKYFCDKCHYGVIWKNRFAHLKTDWHKTCSTNLMNN